MIMEYSRCKIGKRCIFKTEENFVFKKYTLIVAISNSKCTTHVVMRAYSIRKRRYD